MASIPATFLRPQHWASTYKLAQEFAHWCSYHLVCLLLKTLCFVPSSCFPPTPWTWPSNCFLLPVSDLPQDYAPWLQGEAYLDTFYALVRVNYLFFLHMLFLLPTIPFFVIAFLENTSIHQVPLIISPSSTHINHCPFWAVSIPSNYFSWLSYYTEFIHLRACFSGVLGHLAITASYFWPPTSGIVIGT